MYKGIVVLVFCLLACIGSVQAQNDTIKFEEEDFSQYGSVETIPTKRFCSSKVLGLSPSKLISAGFDYQGSSTITADGFAGFLKEDADINYNHGKRFAVNLPVISNTKWLVSLGLTWWDNNYSFKNKENLVNPFLKTLSKNGLRTTGLNITLFKPLNEVWYTLAQGSFDFNGDFRSNQLPESNQLKVSATVLVGKKPHDRRMWGFGISRTYRAGEQAFFPVLLYNYTFKNKKWGIEALLPARANVRYAINARNLIFAGFELEGNAYRLNNLMADNNNLPFNALELKRSELRPRITYEFSLYKFFWVSIQVGYRYNYSFNIDNGDFYRSSGNTTPYIANNNLGNTFYTSISLNLVSP
ncbi:MAG: DUF6268 family outer membrane beta-barrel protein [Bacteroidota bacterium]